MTVSNPSTVCSAARRLTPAQFTSAATGPEGRGIFLHLLGVAHIDLRVAKARLGGDGGFHLSLRRAGGVDGRAGIGKSAANPLPDARGGAGDDDGLAGEEFGCPGHIFPARSRKAPHPPLSGDLSPNGEVG